MGLEALKIARKVSPFYGPELGQELGSVCPLLIIFC
jgi:hypothetical protein